ncbi:MAG: hypothetical protein JWP45_2911 [Mucilaginibacter sp.]|nr:hypothetical protein [Mucilaginibacter sp.]
MDVPLVLQCAEICVAFAAFVYGVYEHNQRKKIADVLKSFTKSSAGDVAKIEESCKWAWVSARDSHSAAAAAPDYPEKPALLKFLNEATFHAEASRKLCVPLFNQLLTLQEAQFNTRSVTHPHKDKLELVGDEVRNSAATTTK